MPPFLATRNDFLASLSVRARRLIPWNYPTQIYLETTERCNLRCIMCGRTYSERHKAGEGVGDMPLATVRKLAPLYRRATQVTAQGFGEPFLHPEMPAILRFLKERGATVTLNTNGSLLDEDVCRTLVEREVDRLVFSIDSPDPETYRRIRVGARLEDVVANIERLNRLRARSRSGKPRLALEFVAMAMNFGQLPALADFAQRHKFDEMIVTNLFKHGDPGYNTFYQKNQLGALDPRQAEAAWAEFLRAMERHGIPCASPFHYGGLRQFLRAEGTREPVESARRMDARMQLLGFIDHPPLSAAVDDRFPVSGWALGVGGVPEAEIRVEGVNQVLLRRRAQLGRPRPDVPPLLPPEFPKEPNCGLLETLDVSGLEPGIYTLRLLARANSRAPWTDLSPVPIAVKAAGRFAMYCTQPWSTIYVTWNGIVRTCCFSVQPFGDLNQQSFEEIWRGPAYRAFRRAVIEGKVAAGCAECLSGKSAQNHIRPLRAWLKFGR
ncbi:MAG: radical SAM/SPASM domain-containing protein [Candidatus Sumerlaeota bacterium]|nr:radical SAM/SPASM domain-containing protein [Candidatus Sumerlaeota bacterium]